MARVYQYYEEPGHLFPFDVRYDPDDIAHCELLANGRVRLRLLTEPGFSEVVVARIDGVGHPMRKYARDRRFDYWEVEVERDGPRLEYTFALRFGDDLPVYLVPAGITNAAERLDFWSLDLIGAPRMEVPEWTKGALIYQIFPDRFAVGDPSLTPADADPWGSPPHSRRFQGGDLYGIIGKANYLSELGIDAVYLNPVFRSLSVHGYDAIDYYEVDPRLGGTQGLADMIAALHARDIRVILDVSFNHCHPHFFAFQDVIERGPDSRYWEWFDVHEHPITVKYRPAAARRRFGDRAEHYLDYLLHTATAAGLTLVEADDDGPPAEPSYESWYGVPTMPRIRLTHPEAKKYFLDVAVHWVAEYGIDGWRMDVARYVDHEFWIAFRRAVKATNRDTYLIAEIMGDAMPWLQGDTFDATMNYQFRELAVSYFATASIDTVRFTDGLIRLFARYAPAAAAASQNLLSSHDTPRFLTLADGDPARLALAVFTQMTVPGAPGLYYGDEVGMAGGEDPGSRGAFPWHDPGSWDEELLDHSRRLGRLRRAHPALKRGDFQIVWQTDGAFAFTRRLDEERLLVAVNRDYKGVSFSIPVAAEAVERIWGQGEVGLSDGAISISHLGAWSGLIVRF